MPAHIIKQCLYCYKDIKKDENSSWIRYNQRKFCSQKCNQENNKTGKYRKCQICKKNIYRRKGELKEKNYCSYKCLGESKRKQFYGRWKDYKPVYQLMWHYHVTEKEAKKWYDERVNGKCYFCGGKQRLVVDHDHSVGKIRGILCSRCNTALGVLGDDLNSIIKIEKYLKFECEKLAEKRKE